MVELGWVNELIENKEWDEKIYQILVLLFLVEGTPEVPDVNNKDAVRKYATERLKKEEGDIGNIIIIHLYSFFLILDFSIYNK